MKRLGMMFVPVALLLAAAGSAHAQDAKEPDSQPLRGPSVRDDTVPGESRRFTGGAQRRKDAVGASIPNRIFIQAIDSLRGERADLRTSATPEMRRRLDQLMPGSAGARARRNAEASPPEQQAKPDGGDNKAMDGSDPMMKEGQAAPEAAQARIAELLAAAPKLEEMHGSVWAVLTPPQREHVEKQVERLKAEAAAKRGDAKDARKQKQAEPAKPNAAGSPDLSKLPPRLRERWESMTPAEREQALKRLKDRG
jgi:predicted Fe-S protein YdhL (DUF1289 family)